jgi:hypothetical protein
VQHLGSTFCENDHAAVLWFLANDHIARFLLILQHDINKTQRLSQNFAQNATMPFVSFSRSQVIFNHLRELVQERFTSFVALSESMTAVKACHVQNVALFYLKRMAGLKTLFKKNYFEVEFSPFYVT